MTKLSMQELTPQQTLTVNGGLNGVIANEPIRLRLVPMPLPLQGPFIILTSNEPITSIIAR